MTPCAATAQEERAPPSDSSTIVRAGAYPAVRAGYAGGSVTSSQQGARIRDADGFVFEPHFDAILTFWDRIGLGANVGYMKTIGDGQRGVTLGGELMVGITPRFVLRALGGYVTGSVSHSFGFDTQTYDASGARFGGGIFYVIARSTHFDVAVAVDILRVSGSRETLPSGEALEYGGTGGFVDFAFAFVP